MAKEHILAHTGLRGIAAALVSLLHMHYEDLIPAEYWYPIMGIAVSWYPVDVFFMLSGFILGYVYVDKLEKPKIDYRDYFVKRFARVAPLHYLTMLAVGVMALVASYLGLPNRGYNLSDILPQIFMVHAYPYVDDVIWNGPSWSISMEFFGYIFIFPLVLALVAKTKQNYPLLLLYIVILGAIWALTEHDVVGWPAISRITCHFSIGYILYALTTFKNPIHSIASKYVTVWLLLGIVWTFTHQYTHLLASRASFQLFIAMIILGTADNKNSIAKTILANKAFLWLGVISYSIYMIHNPIGKIIHVFVNKIPDDLAIRAAVVLSSYLFLLLISWFTYKTFEVPVRNILVKKLAKPKQHTHRPTT